MMSVGPAIHNPYAVNERLELQTISSVWELFEASFSAAGKSAVSRIAGKT